MSEAVRTTTTHREPPPVFSLMVVECPACNHGIDPHGTDPGGICGVGSRDGSACGCLWSPNDIAGTLLGWRASARSRPVSAQTAGPDFEGVLAAHGPFGFSCACGWEDRTATYATAHRAHVAAAVRAEVGRWLGSEGLREIAAYAVERAEKPKNATYDDVARATLAALATQVAPSRVPGVIEHADHSSNRGTRL